MEALAVFDNADGRLLAVGPYTSAEAAALDAIFWASSDPVRGRVVLVAPVFDCRVEAGMLTAPERGGTLFDETILR